MAATGQAARGLPSCRSQAVQRRADGVMSCTVIGPHEVAEISVGLDVTVDGCIVFTGVNSIDLVVATHDAVHTRFDSSLEWRKVDLDENKDR